MAKEKVVLDEQTRRAKSERTAKLVKIAPVAACIILAVLYTVGALAKGYSLSVGYKNIIQNATLVALLSTGATFIFASGSFDLSLGSNMLVSALIGGLVGNATGSTFLMFLTCIALAILISVTNSVLASVFHIPVFIETIAMMSVLAALANLIITQLGSAATVKVSRTLISGLNNTGFRLLCILLFEVFCCVIFYKTKIGRRQKFLGGNPVCAALSGINGSKITILSFVLAGIGIGLAAFNIIVETPTLSSSSGSSVGMNMLIALVFGGMSMSGGPGSKMYAALIGSISMAFLDSFMNLFISGDWYLQIVKGVLFIIVVFMISMDKRGRYLQR